MNDKDVSPSKEYARVKEIQAQMLIEEVLSIVRDPSQDPIAASLRIEIRKWFVDKVCPSLNGEINDSQVIEDTTDRAYEAVRLLDRELAKTSILAVEDKISS